MQTQSGFGYAEVSFDTDAAVLGRTGYDALLGTVRRSEMDDIVVLAHGWNNDATDARALYRDLCGQIRGVVDSGAVGGLGPDGRRIGVLGLLWPSKRFADSDVVHGGAAALGSPVAESALRRQLAHLHGAFDAPTADQALRTAEGLVPALVDSPMARDAFVTAVRTLLPRPATPDPDDVPAQLTDLDGRDLLERLSPPLMPPGRVDTPAEGAAAAFGLSFGGVTAGAHRLLNLLTYYQMKERAGLIGTAASAVLAELRAASATVGLHLVGHSFGARLVTAAAASGGPALRPDSLTLLQAAFSHYGFAKVYDGERDGFFRRLITDAAVRGPVLVTHSVHDLAVGLAYPLVSRLARQAASWLGDADDRYGGLGRNGARKTPEAVDAELLPSGATYQLSPFGVTNLRADGVITSHTDIVRPEVAYAILTAVASRVG